METWIASGTLLLSLLAFGASLASWKAASLAPADGAAPAAEAAEAVSAAPAQAHENREPTSAIGTVLALRSMTLQPASGTAGQPGDDVQGARRRLERAASDGAALLSISTPVDHRADAAPAN